MHRTDPIYRDGHVIGTAHTEKQGLYYRFKCICDPKEPGMYAIYASDGNGSIKLGICVPDGDAFGLKTRIPIKHFVGRELTFTAVNKKTSEHIIQVDQGKPFPFIEKLDKATYFCERGAGSIILHQDTHYPKVKDSVNP